MHDWWKAECTKSIDGLPALEAVLYKTGTPFKHNWVRPPPNVKWKDAGSKKTKGGAVAGQSVALNSFALDDRLFGGFVVGVSFALLMHYAFKMFGISVD
jgi:hypothetical protein